MGLIHWAGLVVLLVGGAVLASAPHAITRAFARRGDARSAQPSAPTVVRVGGIVMVLLGVASLWLIMA